MVTRSLHPLPFEHLEPKRFEDLVRQLVYDFRRWRMLEGTGRAGSDDGYDARGYEIIDLSADEHNARAQEEDDDQHDGDDDVQPSPSSDRIWLIQCKRERRIGPSKIVAHLDALPADTISEVYGVIFAAACDFSKATRDAGRTWCRERGIQEVHVWGKAEIEDLLYQPKNDNLLFAYFGISLRIRRQSLSTGLRRITTLKRKIKRVLPDQGWPGTPFVLRDPSDDRYPWTGDKLLSQGDFKWQPRYAKGPGVKGLLIVGRCFPAFYRYQTGEWDIASAVDNSVPHEARDLWPEVEELADRHERARRVWWSLPNGNQVNFLMTATILYEDILEIDEIGDEYCSLPTVFVTFKDGQPPLANYGSVKIIPTGYGAPEDARPKRWVNLFPETCRDLEWEKRWQDKYDFLSRPTDPYQFQLQDGTTWVPPETKEGDDGEFYVPVPD